MVKKTIGQLLIERGHIDAQQLGKCEQETAQDGKSVTQCLLANEYVTAQQLAQTYADYAGLSYVELITDEMADLNVLGKAPLKFLRDNCVMPVIIDGTLTILTSNPLHYQPLDELNLLLGGAAFYAVAPANVIMDGINKYYPLEGAKQMIEELRAEEPELEEVAFEGIEEKDILAMATEAPIIKLVNHILYQAVKRDASDIHIEPFEKELSVRYRIDGILYPAMSPPKRIQGALTSRIKIMANMNIAEKRVPLDGRIQIKVADKAFDIRVSSLPVAFGERIVMRLLDKSRTFANLGDLGFSPHDLQMVQDNIAKPNGIIFVTGPTGSGKTTTLYSVLAVLNKPSVNIVTVEDPVEYQMQGVGQVQVKDKVGLTFATALRSILRQDPDIVMIGETRDAETAQIAIQAALTGHLVLSTLHTNNAPSSITRLIDMGVEPFLISSSVIMIMAQRLVRKLCEACRQVSTPTVELLGQIGVSAQEAKKITFYTAVGCQECLQTGYRGRLAIFEVMPMSSGVAQLAMERADAAVIGRQAQQDGMTTLLEDGVRKIKAGLTTIEEVLSVATMEHELVE